MLQKIKLENQIYTRDFLKEKDILDHSMNISTISISTISTNADSTVIE